MGQRERTRWWKIRRNPERQWGKVEASVPIYPDQVILEDQWHLGPIRICRYRLLDR